MCWRSGLCPHRVLHPQHKESRGRDKAVIIYLLAFSAPRLPPAAPCEGRQKMGPPENQSLFCFLLCVSPAFPEASCSPRTPRRAAQMSACQV